MDYLNSIKSYIEDNMTLYKTPLSVNMMRDGNDIAIRVTPGSTADRYTDKRKIFLFRFQILTKHETDKAAFEAIQSITTELDGLTNRAITSSDGSFILNKCEVYTLPNFIEQTSHGESIYSAIFQAEILIRGVTHD